MAKNSAEAMPHKEAPKDEEEIELSDEDIEIVGDVEPEKSETEQALEGLKDISKEREAEKAKKEDWAKFNAAAKSKFAKDRTKRDMADLRKKLGEVKEKRDLAQSETNVLSGSADDRIRNANTLRIPNFDHEGYDELVDQEERMRKSLEAIDSGEVKVGWFRKWRMKRRYAQVKRELKPLEDEVVQAKLDARQDIDRQKENLRQSKLTPEQKAAEAKKKEDEGKRGASRWGMSGGPRF